MSLPETIIARVDANAISAASRFFDATLRDILTELLQNARRAGATEIEITEDRERISVFDDGPGIPDPQVLFDFGRSQWTNDIEAIEDSAGMGFFALASRGALIASHGVEGRGWSVNLCPNDFHGRKPVAVTAVTGEPGTAITFPRRASDEPLTRILQDITRHYPLPVRFVSQSGDVSHFSGTDFLQDCDYVADMSYGRIGITSQRIHKTINLHGHTIATPLPSRTALDGTRYSAKLDLTDTRRLRLVLPARKEVVKDDAFDRIQVDLTRIIYEYIATLEAHTLKTEDVLEAQSLAVKVGWSVARLRPWSANTHSTCYAAHGCVDIPEGAVVVPDMEVADEQFLRFSDYPTENLFEARDELRGTPWYDALTRIESIECRLTLGDERYTIDSLCGPCPYGISRDPKAARAAAERDELLERFKDADGIEAIVTISDDTTLTATSRAALYVPDGCSAEEVLVIAVKSTERPVQPAELEDYFYQTTFQPSDDCGADSFETQDYYFREEMTSLLRERLLTDREARRIKITEYATKACYNLKEGEAVTIVLTRKGVQSLEFGATEALASSD